MVSRTGNCIRNVWWADIWWLKVDRIIGWHGSVDGSDDFVPPVARGCSKFHSFESEIIDFLVATCYWLVEGIYLVLTRLLWSLIENRCETGRNILVATTRLVSSWNIISDRLIRWLNRGIWQIWILSFPSDFNTFDIFLKMVMFGYYSIINASIRYKMYMHLFILYILIFKVLVTYRSTNIFIILTFK